MVRTSRIIIVLLSGLLLVSCRNQQAAFRFSPPPLVAAAATMTKAGPPPPASAAFGPAAAMDRRVSAAAAPLQRLPGRRPLAAARLSTAVRLVRRVLPVVRGPRLGSPKPATAARADNPPASPLERGALLVGLGSLALGLLLKFVLSVASLATIIQLIFYVSALALALWFGLLLLRAMRES